MEHYHQIIPERIADKVKDFVTRLFYKPEPIIPEVYADRPAELETPYSMQPMETIRKTNLEAMMDWQRKKYRNG